MQVFLTNEDLQISAWNNDIKEPKWTNRECPKWYKEEHK